MTASAKDRLPMLDNIKKTLWATADKLHQLTECLSEQMAKGTELDALIRQKMAGLGYDC
jgi:hypothetical protein